MITHVPKKLEPRTKKWEWEHFVVHPVYRNQHEEMRHGGSTIVVRAIIIFLASIIMMERSSC